MTEAEAAGRSDVRGEQVARCESDHLNQLDCHGCRYCQNGEFHPISALRIYADLGRSPAIEIVSP